MLITPGNASDAYRRAGGGSKDPDVSAAMLMKIPAVISALAAGQKKIAIKLEVTAEKVLAGLDYRASANFLDFGTIDDNGHFVPDLRRMTREQATAISEITVDHTGGSGDGERIAVLRTRIKMVDQLRALELLGKHLKLFTDIVKHEGLESLTSVLAGKD